VSNVKASPSVHPVDDGDIMTAPSPNKILSNIQERSDLVGDVGLEIEYCLQQPNNALSSAIAFHDHRDRETPDAVRDATVCEFHHKALHSCQTSCILAGKYVIQPESLCDESNACLALNDLSDQLVILKFYSSRKRFHDAKRLYKLTKRSEHVCKLLDSIEHEPGFPPCLVLECGQMTLEQWLEKTPPLAERLADLHALSVVHRDLKPSSVMYFPQDGRWKLIDLDAAAIIGEEAKICCTLEYACPEVIIADSQKETRMVTQTSMDLFSLGIICFEVITGERFYGDDFSEESIREAVISGTQWSRRRRTDLPQAQHLIDSLTARNPGERLPATEVLKDYLFRTQTAQNTPGNDFVLQMSSDMAELRRLAEISFAETHVTNLLIDLRLECFRKRSQPHTPFFFRETKPAVSMKDEKRPNHVIFLTNIGRDYLIRGCIRRNSQMPLCIKHIISVHIGVCDGITVELPVHEVTKDSESFSFVALLEPAKLESAKMTSFSPLFGSFDQKYIELDVTVEVLIGGAVRIPVPLKGTIFCRMHHPSRRFIVRKLIRSADRAWSYIPQPARDGTRLLLSVAETIAFH